MVKFIFSSLLRYSSNFTWNLDDKYNLLKKQYQVFYIKSMINSRLVKQKKGSQLTALTCLI